MHINKPDMNPHPGRLFTGSILLAGLILLLASCMKKEKDFIITALTSNTDHHLRTVHFYNESSGFAAGGIRYFNGTVVNTGNGGQRWQKDSILDKIIFDLYGLNDSVIFAACLDGKILRSTDRGNSWTTHQNDPWIPLYGIDFVNDSTGFVVGGGGYRTGIILKTTDQGLSWEPTLIKREMRCVGFFDENRGFAAGFGMLLKTDDGGKTWDSTGIDGDLFRQLCIPGASTGYLIGNNGTILKTEDRGDSWDRLRNGNSPFPPKLYFRGAYFIDHQKGYIVGQHGLMLTTGNGGRQWKRVKSFTQEDLQDVWATSGGIGYVAGENGSLFKFRDP